MRTGLGLTACIAAAAWTNMATAADQPHQRLHGLQLVLQEGKFHHSRAGTGNLILANTPTPTQTTTSPEPTPTSTTATTTAVPTPSSTPAPTPSATPAPSPTPATTPASTPETTTPLPTPASTPAATPETTTPLPTPSSTPAATPETTTPLPTPSSTPASTPETTTAEPTPTPATTPIVTPAATNNTDPTTKPLTTIPVTTDLPIVTEMTSAPILNTTKDLLNGTQAPATTVPADGLVDFTPSPSKAPGAPSTEVTEPPAPSRPPSAARSVAPEGGAPNGDDVQISVAGSDTNGNKTNRYVFNAVVGLTLVFLAFFHYLAIDPSFLAPESTAGALAAPNSWELPSFASFMQLVAVVSCANVDAPHAIFVSFTDSFSWVNFIVRGSAYSEKSTTVVASSLLSHLSSSHRALAATHFSTTSYDAFGFFQFALRMNVFEYDLFVRAWTFFFIAVMCLLVLVIATAAVSQFTGRRTPFTQSDSGSYTSTLKEASRRMQGFTIWFISMAVLPLTTVSMYELMRDITSAAGFGSITGIFALLAIILLGVTILAAGYIVLRHTEVQLSKYRTKITFGVLYTNYKFEFRAFFAVALLVQYASGLLLAGVVAPSTQLILLMAVHGAYVVLVVAVRPFMTVLQLVFTVVFELVLVAVFGVAYGMARTTDTDSKLTLAYVVIILVCVVIFLMFVRNLVKLWTYVTGAASYDMSTRTNAAIPPLHSAEYNSNRGADTISLNSGSLNSDHHYTTLTTPSKTVKLVDTTAKV